MISAKRNQEEFSKAALNVSARKRILLNSPATNACWKKKKDSVRPKKVTIIRDSSLPQEFIVSEYLWPVESVLLIKKSGKTFQFAENITIQIGHICPLRYYANEVDENVPKLCRKFWNKLVLNRIFKGGWLSSHRECFLPLLFPSHNLSNLTFKFSLRHYFWFKIVITIRRKNILFLTTK